MSVRFATADAFPYVCTEYVCACGATAHAHGRNAGSFPAGWVQVDPPRAGDEADHLCPHCARATGGRAAGPEPR